MLSFHSSITIGQIRNAYGIFKDGKHWVGFDEGLQSTGASQSEVKAFPRVENPYLNTNPNTHTNTNPNT